jgi:anti-sigma B factor antagonist
METEVRSDGGSTIVEVSGVIDVACSLELRDALASLLGTAGANVLLDLSGVSLIDSSGIGILVGAHRQADASGAKLVLAAPAGPAARVFELTRTNKLLRIEPTVEQGLAALRE